WQQAMGSHTAGGSQAPPPPPAAAGGGETQRTQYPYVTGTSVIALKYKDGVIMACDTGASYGSTLRYKSVERIKAVGKHSLIGASGDLSDHMWDDGNSLGPKEIHSYLTRVMYNRRNKFDPLWNSLVLGGVKKGPKGDEKYLGMVNMIGTHFEENHIATGFGNHLAIPILRAEWHEDMTFEEAVKLVEKCLLVLLYRDRSSINKFQIAKITAEGSTIYPPYSLKTYWGFSHFENPAQGAVGSW
ncbi:Proteasome subunit beta type-4, partial [Dichanthelium oligosanthes]